MIDKTLKELLEEKEMALSVVIPKWIEQNINIKYNYLLLIYKI